MKTIVKKFCDKCEDRKDMELLHTVKEEFTAFQCLTCGEIMVWTAKCGYVSLNWLLEEDFLYWDELCRKGADGAIYG